MAIALRVAGLEDAAEIAGLVNRAYRPGAGLRGWTHEAALVDGPRASEEMVRALFRPGSTVLVLAEGPAILACAHVEAKLAEQGVEAYIGMLIDDLVTKGTSEPYRIMTSRAEYRLLLRQDNADQRLTPLGRRVGLVQNDRWERFTQKQQAIQQAMEMLRKTSINPSQDIKTKLAEAGIEPIRNATSFYELLRRPDVSYDKLQTAFGLPELADEVRQQVEISITYEGYIQKQLEQVERMEKLEEKLLPEDIDYQQVPSLRDEGREKLEKIRPRSVGQASRISGVSPADVSVLLVWLEQQRRMKEK